MQRSSYTMNILRIVFSIMLVVCLSEAVSIQLEKRKGNPHNQADPGQGQAEKCLECRLSDHMTFEECMNQPGGPPYETCRSARPECMTQLHNWPPRAPDLVFVSECQELEACIQEADNEPWHNNCDSLPLVVTTKCRYCCDASNLTVIDDIPFCKPPTVNQICKVHGDPHFQTFDGKLYRAGGDCLYALANIGDDLHLRIEEEAVGNNGRYRVKTLTIQKGSGDPLTIGFNDGSNPVPLDLGGSDITGTTGTVGTNDEFDLAMHDGNMLTVTMDINDDGLDDLVVKWKKNYHLELHLTHPIGERFPLSGLCGDGNDDPDDDCRTPGGVVVNDPEVFHESWGDCGA